MRDRSRGLPRRSHRVRRTWRPSRAVWLSGTPLRCSPRTAEAARAAEGTRRPGASDRNALVHASEGKADATRHLRHRAAPRAGVFLGQSPPERGHHGAHLVTQSDLRRPAEDAGGPPRVAAHATEVGRSFADSAAELGVDLSRLERPAGYLAEVVQ